jgi:mannose-6-phosphate isomerase-like protein (cupin superfamily)
MSVTAVSQTGYSVRHQTDAPKVPCPCGESTRIITAADDLGMSFHVTAISDSIRHYHKTVREVYYILTGTGTMELNDDTVQVEPGTVVTIEPYTRHRLTSIAGITTIVLAIPAFNPDDEYFD